ncbi:hypothetical protein GCM10009727_94410 [Actinomadura napierensis]|uniref:Uncharacterized protein n=1 Tax=Actinomadura napierensis TaxID=267854 RepID=A0ABN3AIA3_9ACTN
MITLPLTSLSGTTRWLLAGLGAAVLASFAGWERHCGRSGGQPLINPALAADSARQAVISHVQSLLAPLSLSPTPLEGLIE